MRIVIIGSGNVATVLGKKCIEAGHQVLQVFSRSLSHARDLAAMLNAAAVDSVTSLDRSADIYLVAVSDQALMHISDWLVLDGQMIVHTAGSVPLHILENTSRHHGVLYPLQTLRTNTPVAQPIPLLIDANTEAGLQLVSAFARSISHNVQQMGDAQRLTLHVAAVVANNFTNHLYTLTELFCQKEGVPFELLHPLLLETAQRLERGSPSDMQTGPASRGDVLTLEKHLDILRDHPDMRLLYQLFSESIQRHRQA